jgi:hypothetical protein
MEDLPAESLPTPPNYGKRRSPDSGSAEVIFGLIRLARNEIYRSHPPRQACLVILALPYARLIQTEFQRELESATTSLRKFFADANDLDAQRSSQPARRPYNAARDHL